MILWKEEWKEGIARKGLHIAMMNREGRRNEGAAFVIWFCKSCSKSYTGICYAIVPCVHNNEKLQRLENRCNIKLCFPFIPISSPDDLNKQPTSYISSKMIQELSFPFRRTTNQFLFPFVLRPQTPTEDGRNSTSSPGAITLVPLFEVGCMWRGCVNCEAVYALHANDGKAAHLLNSLFTPPHSCHSCSS
jgi:hypothetical protein